MVIGIKGKAFRKNELLFLLKFFAVFLALQYLLVAFEPFFLESSLASFEAGLLGLKSEGNIIYISGNPFVVSPNCSGLLSAAVFAAIVFSLRKPGIKGKIVTAAIGAVSLFILNIGRLYVVLASGKAYGVQFAETVHMLSWFFVFGAVIAIWYVLAKKSHGSLDGLL